MKKVFLQILFGLFATLAVFSQESNLKPIDEFGEIYLDEFRFRIESAGRELEKTPNSKVLVRIYGGNKRGFAQPYIYGSLIKSVWKNYLKIPSEKLSIQFCNVNNETLLMRYYLAQANARLDTCEENLKMPQESVLFETSFFDVTDFSVARIDFDSIENDYPSIEGTRGNYSEFAQNILKKLLKNSPESRVYIIGYLNTNFETDNDNKVIAKNLGNLDKKSRLNKMFQAMRREFLKNGFSSSQIKTIDGEYVKNNGRRLEFWFVPKGGEIPKPKPDYIVRKNRK